MAKLLLILFIGLVFEAAGVVFLKKGITQVGEVRKVNAAEIVRIVKSGAANPCVLLGVFFEALFFRGLLQGQLVERFGAGIGVGVTAIVFGAVHIANDPGVAGLLLALSVGAGGVALGTVRHLTGRLGSSMATHSLFNAIAIAAFAASSAIR